jgi:hypothetical protein
VVAQEIEVGRDTETKRKICGSKKSHTNAVIVRVTERPTLSANMAHIQRIRGEESS